MKACNAFMPSGATPGDMETAPVQSLPIAPRSATAGHTAAQPPSPGDTAAGAAPPRVRGSGIAYFRARREAFKAARRLDGADGRPTNERRSRH